LVDDRRCGVWMYYSIVDSVNDLHVGLLKYLRETLPVLEFAAADRERLAGFSRQNRCT
jgi:DNA-binding transcriptional ArsR family regulator